MSKHQLRFQVNGESREVSVPAHRRLIDVIREDLGLTGTKEGCSVGVCGACTVLVDGDMMSACIMPALFVDGTSVQTIEGLAPDLEHLTPLQDAFIRHGGFQCGICTPGQIMAATALLEDNPQPTTDDVKRWMMGNLCRCTGYYKIVESILAAADVMAGKGDPGPAVGSGARGQGSRAGGLAGPGVLPGPGAGASGSRANIVLDDPLLPDTRPLTPNPSAER